jgi:hypothetical protein
MTPGVVFDVWSIVVFCCALRRMQKSKILQAAADRTTDGLRKILYPDN